jgi:spore germination protein GerM
LPFETKPETINQKATIVEQKKSTVKVERKLPQTAFKSKPTSSFVATRKPLQTKKTTSPKAEIATDFIALSYLPATESGQIVRVKVPRSMLVSLGVTTNVEKPSELVNAEVIVGDDGGTRAIRFLAN